jgi:hypothetical protein
MVRPIPIHHFEGEGLDAVVVPAVERDRQVDFAERVGLHARQDAIEGEEGGLQDSHGIESVVVEDVEAAAPVHQHLGQQTVAEDGIDDKGVMEVDLCTSLPSGVPEPRRLPCSVTRLRLLGMQDSAVRGKDLQKIRMRGSS